MKSGFNMALLACAAMVLTACGGSSSDDNSAQAYLQFYNGAAGSGNTSLKAGDIAVGSATFGDATSVQSLDVNSYELTLTDVSSADELLTETLPLNEGDKTLLILTEQAQQYDYLSLSFKREDTLDKQFKLHLVNLSDEQTALDVYLSPENKGFADAQLLDSLALHEISSLAEAKDIGKFNLYLTSSGSTTPLFVARSVNFAYASHYVLIVRDKHGPVAGQMSVDLLLHSSSVTAYNHADAPAQFRLYNSLTEQVSVALDNNSVTALTAGQLSDYLPLNKGDFSLSVRDGDNQLLLNSALLSISAGDSKAVLLYADAQQQVEALAINEPATPQVQAHDVIVANLASDFDKLQFYFVRENETIADARYSVKNLAFKKQQSINLPKDYYAIALVHVAENGSTTLLDKTDSLQLTPEQRYMLLAEQDDAAPSGYKLTLVH